MTFFESDIKFNSVINMIYMYLSILFIQVVSKSFKIFRKNQVASAMLIAFIIILLIFIIDTGVIVLCGAKLTFISPFGMNVNMDNIDEKLYNICTNIQDITFMCIYFVTIVKLMNKRYEIS